MNNSITPSASLRFGTSPLQGEEKIRRDKSLHDPADLQRRATDPAAHVWVAASAGSGKTTVLVGRVLRLLLGDDTTAPALPHKILCLTFTKAAAAEMADRVQKRLGMWVSCDDDTLINDLTALIGHHPSPKLQNRARQLFARVSDIMGGLKIQTIHGFCQSVLARFPIEAGIAPNFTALDDVTGGQLLRTAMARALYTDDDSWRRQRHYLLTSFNEEQLYGRLKNMRRNWPQLAAEITGAGGFENYIAGLRAFLNVSHDNSDSLWQENLAPVVLADGKIARLMDALQHGSPDRDRKLLDALHAFLALDDTARVQRRGDYLKVFLTDKGIRKNIPAKSGLAHDPAANDIFNAEGARLLALQETEKTVFCAFTTTAWLMFLARTMAIYDGLKQRRNALDFDDLITITRDLLADDGRAAWVLYKLDGGIDHILVDEAQDTSAVQWQVVAALAQEFFVGQSAHEGVRTLFAVGDEKQSIFSFQGADVAGFDRMQQHFAKAAAAAENPLQVAPLFISFRSAPAILDVVDRVFVNDDLRRSIQSDPTVVLEHRPYRRDAGGRVELWPLTSKLQSDDDSPWDIAADMQNADPPAVRLAVQLADKIADWLTSGRRLAALDRVVTPGDIMVLVRRRGKNNEFIGPLVKELKARNIPVAGVDRLKLTEHIAVEDMLRLLEFLLLPEDDLALANILKSPLVGWTDDDLFQIAHDRAGRLWPALPESPVRDYLNALLARADYISPYDMIAGILNQPCPADAVSGMRAMIARLGTDASDPLLELLNLAAEFTRAQAGTTQQFIDWLLHNAPEIKRELASAHANEVRILTVHSAKGLEAPIVILADTTGLPDDNKDALPRWLLPDASLRYPLWAARAADECAAFRTHQAARLQDLWDEYQRLLYVALTRARDELYICGYSNKSEAPERSWYHSIATALASFDHVAQADGSLLYKIEPRAIEHAPAAAAISGVAATLPDWIYTAAPVEPVTQARSVTAAVPDDLLALSRALPLHDAIKRGNLVHRLLQTLPDLPASEREGAALRYLAHAAGDWPVAQHQAIYREIAAVLTHTDFAPLFTMNGRAEVPLIGRLDGAIITGRIDRLLIQPHEIMIVDYKTNLQPPTPGAALPHNYVAQLRDYAALLQKRYPGRRIRMGLLWTALPRLDEISSEISLQATA